MRKTLRGSKESPRILEASSEHDILDSTIYLKCARTAVSEIVGCVSHSLLP